MVAHPEETELDAQVLPSDQSDESDNEANRTFDTDTNAVLQNAHISDQPEFIDESATEQPEEVVAIKHGALPVVTQQPALPKYVALQTHHVYSHKTYPRVIPLLLLVYQGIFHNMQGENAQLS
jgi:hypothetical protein